MADGRSVYVCLGLGVCLGLSVCVFGWEVCVCVWEGGKINLGRQWLSLPVSLTGQALQPLKHITNTNTQNTCFKDTNTHYKYINTQTFRSVGMWGLWPTFLGQNFEALIT